MKDTAPLSSVALRFFMLRMGEPVPKTMADAKRLAAKGKRLLEKYKVAKSKVVGCP